MRIGRERIVGNITFCYVRKILVIVRALLFEISWAIEHVNDLYFFGFN
jgi:flagellar biosynthesis protein FliQ